MALSNDFETTYTRDTLLESAAEIGGILDPESGQLSPSQKVRIIGYLNNMIKAWQADGMQVWIRKLFTVILEKNKSTYTLPWNSTDYNPYLFTGDYISTTLTSGSGTSIVLPSTDTMVANGYLAIEKDDGTYFFGTIASVDSATGLTLVSGGTGYLVGGNVYYYTKKVPRISRIYDGFVRSPQGFDIPMRIITREEYNRFGVKNTPGTTVQVFYDMGWPTGTLYLYPTLNTNGNLLFLEGMFPFQVFVNPSDLPDFPEEWINAIIYGLAEEIAFRYGMDEKRMALVAQKALYWKSMALGMSQENSIYLQPEPNMYGQK